MEHGSDMEASGESKCTQIPSNVKQENDCCEN
jgi:hypothetical protein